MLPLRVNQPKCELIGGMDWVIPHVLHPDRIVEWSRQRTADDADLRGELILDVGDFDVSRLAKSGWVLCLGC